MNNIKRFTKDGQILSLNQIHIYHEDGSITINISEQTALENGWEVYVEPEVKQLQDFAVEICNTSTTMPDEQALEMAEYFNEWETYIGKSLNVGQIVKYQELLYRVRQAINEVLEGQYPSMDTAALYEVIELTATGTIEDPIPYNPPMEIFAEKYYTQNDVLYKCTRDSGQALTHNLSELVGLYVEIVEESAGTEELEPTLAEEGTIDNPIAYVPPMELFMDKYYTQNGVTYVCTRNSDQELTHDLEQLVGLYVNKI